MLNSALFSSKKDDWETPDELFLELNRVFQFNLDVCATAENAKCDAFFTKNEDGLLQDWSGRRCWCNPPYGRGIGEWCKKAVESGAEVVVLLIPARTDTAWFHDWVLPFMNIRFLRGRIKFKGATNSAPFPSMIAVYGSAKYI